MTRVDPRWCASACLAFRHVALPGVSFCADVAPWTPRGAHAEPRPVADDHELEEALRAEVAAALDRAPTALLLSGGMDSAVLAATLPAGTRAYTLRFEAPGALDESGPAAAHARAFGLDHRVVTVRWADVASMTGPLCRSKGAILHPVEVGLALAARAAAAEGARQLLVGNGADSNFGGLDRLLSRDWTPEAFAARYTFLDPARALADPVPVDRVYAPYARGDHFDVQRFLAEVHGQGIVQAFDHALAAGGCEMAAPFEAVRLKGPLDLARVRSGDSKYVVRALYRRLVGPEPPDKVAFARPMDAWLAGWGGPRRPGLLPDVSGLGGEQRYLVWCLERLLEELRVP